MQIRSQSGGVWKACFDYSALAAKGENGREPKLSSQAKRGIEMSVRRAGPQRRLSPSCRARLQPLGLADHGDQHLAATKKAGCGGAGNVEVNRLDKRVAAVDIIDPELVELDLHELARDLRG